MNTIKIDKNIVFHLLSSFTKNIHLITRIIIPGTK